ncbi:MAG: SDR family NAD(P)-dependent oxidoreductase [Sphingobium sp.]
MTMRGLKGKSILITGGASGIGRATAAALARSGCLVTIGDRDEAAGNALAAELTAEGGSVHFQRCDVTSEDDAAALVHAVLDQYGRLDGACYSAGLSTVRKPLIEMSREEWSRATAVNLDGAFLALKHQLPAMIGAGGGSIVLIASMAAMKGTPMAADYCASKSGMLGLMRSAAAEYSAQGVRINVIMPGATATPMLEAATSPEHSAGLIARTPIHRIAEPREIADSVCWLLSEEASFVTGAAIPVDGGMSAL